MNARARRARYLLRARRYGWEVRPPSPALLAHLHLVPGDAAGDVDQPSLVAARIALLFQAFSVGDGIAYVPNGAAGLAGIVATTEQDPAAGDVDQEDDDPDARRGCERGCPLGECYHGEPFYSDFDDPWDGA